MTYAGCASLPFFVWRMAILKIITYIFLSFIEIGVFDFAGEQGLCKDPGQETNLAEGGTRAASGEPRP